MNPTVRTSLLCGILIVLLQFLTVPAAYGSGSEDAVPEPSESEDADAYRDMRLVMVEWQIESRDIVDEEVLRAMRKVPRHLFVPSEEMPRAYEDHPVPIGYGQTVSQPFIVAYMTQLLEVEPGDRILEIGTGSGYQAAVLAEITDQVYTVEIIGELAQQASLRLDELGYKSIRVKKADGYWGWSEEAPFDGIIITAAAGHIPPPLIAQLAYGGRMVLPMGHPYQTQYITVIDKKSDGSLTGRQVLPVRFVPFTGHIRTAEP